MARDANTSFIWSSHIIWDKNSMAPTYSNGALKVQQEWVEETISLTPLVSIY